ncbi:MAG: leucine-rich repeat domain-containing protein, partial [Solobacterium sp.]|nr:leucine-rich repeat domain-containing protein [Solobacterium sp.]
MTSMKRDSLEGCSGLKSAGPAGSGADYEYGWTVSIPAYVFSGCTGLTNIAFPEGLQEIRGGAFTDCAGLKELPLPSSVKFVGSGHLIDCTSLVSFAVPDGTETLDTTFMGCTSLNTVTIPVSVKLIDMYTFDGVPNGLTVIYKGSASEWDAITISKAGNTVLDSAEIIYESGEESYVTEDGYRYTINDDIVRIIGYEGTDSVLSIPAAIEGKWVASVGGKGFRGNKNITEITIGEGIEELDPYAFSA